MSVVKNDNYYVVQGFMITELGLKGNELAIYAIVYGFSQMEGQYFTGSLQYLADWTNSTKRGVNKALISLVEKGLLEKRDKVINKVKYCDYRALRPDKDEQSSIGGIEQSSIGIEQSSIGGIEQSSIGIEQSSIHNKENNIDLNKLEDSERKKAAKKSSGYNEIIDTLVTNPKLKAALIEFIKMRKLSKKPLTDHALELAINKLYKLSSDPETQVEIVEQSILNNWQSFFPLKQMDNKIGAKGYSERGSSRDKQYADYEMYINFGKSD